MASLTRDKLLHRLRINGNFQYDKIERFKSVITMSDYFSRSDHRGGVAIPGQRFYRMDGTEHLFEHVPFAKVLKAVESIIKNEVPEDKRKEVYEKVIGDMTGSRARPSWLQPVSNPRGQPQYPFSASRIKPPQPVKSNAQLINELASAAGLDSGQVRAIGIQITWWDSIDDEGNGGVMSFSDGVRGGRLGRDHSLNDVPNHYVRDRIMDYINEKVPEGEQKKARKMVFSDLTSNEIGQYSALVSAERETDGNELAKERKRASRKERTKHAKRVKK